MSHTSVMLTLYFGCVSLLQSVCWAETETDWEQLDTRWQLWRLQTKVQVIVHILMFYICTTVQIKRHVSAHEEGLTPPPPLYFSTQPTRVQCEHLNLWHPPAAPTSALPGVCAAGGPRGPRGPQPPPLHPKNNLQVWGENKRRKKKKGAGVHIKGPRRGEE